MTHRANPREIFEQSLALQFTDVAGQADLFAEDGVMEFPFTPRGLVRLTGPEAIREFLRQNGFSPDGLRLDSHTDLTVHQTTDPEVIVAEYTAHVTFVPTGVSSALPCIKVVRVHDGKISLYRDYTNPLATLQAMDRLEPFARGLLSK